MVCNAPLFQNVPWYSGFTCYPTVALTTPPGLSQCECDDVEVSFDVDIPGGGKTLRACLAPGKQTTTDPIRVPIIDIAATPLLGQADIKLCHLETTLDGEEIPLEVCYGFYQEMDLDGDGAEDDPVYILQGQGQAVASEVWMWQAIIPAGSWAAGPLDIPDDVGELSLGVTLFRGELVGVEIETMWLEALAYDGTITVVEEGEICSDRPCERATIEVDVDFAAIRADVDMEP
jgi:hypothetical protein